MAKPKVNSNGNVEWRVNTAEFKGYVKAKLEEIHADIQESKAEIKNNREKLLSLDKRTIVLALIVSGVVVGGEKLGWMLLGV